MDFVYFKRFDPQNTDSNRTPIALNFFLLLLLIPTCFFFFCKIITIKDCSEIIACVILNLQNYLIKFICGEKSSIFSANSIALELQKELCSEAIR